MNVVAAVIRRGDRFLLCQRPLRKQHGGLWEFPGGKIQERESPFCALKRELEEELGVQSVPLSNTVTTDIKIIGETMLSIRFIETEIQGEPIMIEHQNMGWFSAAELLELDLAPADAKFAARYFKAA